MKKTWGTPVNKERHEELIAQGFSFVESRYENEIEVSKYRNSKGSIKRVSYDGRVLDGD